MCKKQSEIYSWVRAVSEGSKPVWGLMGDARDCPGCMHHRIWKIIPLGHGTWKETFLNVRSSFNRDIVGHAVAVTGGSGLGDEVIADAHCHKAMYALIQAHQMDVHSSL